MALAHFDFFFHIIIKYVEYGRIARARVISRDSIFQKFIFLKPVAIRESTGCPKSHCAKVRAYCSACDHLICKISSGMFQKSSSFEDFNGFSEIDVHFFE